MRLLHVIASMDPRMGGVCQAVNLTAEKLSELGVHNEIVSLDAPDAPFINSELFPMHAIGRGRGPWRYSPALISWLLKNSSGYDALILHGLWLYPGYAIQKVIGSLKRRLGAFNKGNVKIPKLFIMPHGMLDPYFQQAEGRKLKAIRNWIYWKLIERKVVNRADGLFFTCEEELRMAKKSFKPYKPVQEINVGLGIIEPPAYDSKMRRAFLEKCPGLNSPYLLFLSRIHEKKGVDILIKAYSELAKKMAEVNAEVPMAGLSTGLYEEQDYIRHELPKLVIAGPGGETSYGKKIQKIVLDHPQLCNSVFFPGMLSGDSKWGAFYGCEAFVLPSHQENFGIAVVEALACSKPVLISSQVNIWREIEAGGAGIVAANSQQETGEMLSNWLNLSVDVKEEMRLHARACYINHFAIARAARRMLEAVVD